MSMQKVLLGLINYLIGPFTLEMMKGLFLALI